MWKEIGEIALTRRGRREERGQVWKLIWPIK
jgi:hypothetical protein